MPQKNNKNYAELNNPCLKEQDLSYKCLNDNDYDKDKCSEYFENYRVCKKFWGFVQSNRRREGIRPLLPPPEQREEIKKEYMPKYKKYL